MNTTMQRQLRRDAFFILLTCRSVTRGPYGDAVITVRHKDAVTPTGLRVRLTTALHAETAIAALRVEGFAVADDSREDEFGAALLVTGWDLVALRRHSARMEQAVKALNDALADLSSTILSVYCDFFHDRAMSPAQAQKATVDVFRRNAGDTAFQILNHEGDDAPRTELEEPLDHDEAIAFYLDRVDTSHRSVNELVRAHQTLAIDVVTDYRGTTERYLTSRRAQFVSEVAQRHAVPVPSA